MAALKSILSSRVSKWMGHTIATIFSPRSYCQTYSVYPKVGFCLLAGRCTGASSARHRRSPGAKGVWLHSSFHPTLWLPNSPNLNPVDYSIWRVLQDKVYQSRIANVNELEIRLVDEWTRSDQSSVDAAIGLWRCCLSACIHLARHTLSIKYNVSAILSSI